MDRLTRRIVLRLRAPGAPLSRNRHYSMFDTPEGRRALKIHRRVRAVERDLLSHGATAEVSLVPARDDMVRIELRIPRLKARRTSFLTRSELDILLESHAGRLLHEWTKSRTDITDS